MLAIAAAVYSPIPGSVRSSAAVAGSRPLRSPTMNCAALCNSRARL
jgi:hypothetical protein